MHGSSGPHQTNPPPFGGGPAEDKTAQHVLRITSHDFSPICQFVHNPIHATWRGIGVLFEFLLFGTRRLTLLSAFNAWAFVMLALTEFRMNSRLGTVTLKTLKRII